VGIWRALRGIPSWVWPALIAVLLLTVPFWGLDFSTTRQIQLALTLALMTSGLNLSLGYAGELALGQAAMYAAGAYGAGYVSKHFSTDIVLQLVVAGVLALVVGILTGVPGLRLGSWSLAMTSFFLVLLVPDLLAIFKEETGGRNGLSGIKNPTLFGSVLDSHQLFWVMAIVVILWFAFMRNLVTSRTGIAFRVLKQSPVLASSMGISVYRMKLQAYALGAVPAGLAGALFANIDRYLSPESFGFGVTTTVLAASILGGSASIIGAAVGAFIMQFGPNQSSQFQQYSQIFVGLFLLIGGVLLTGGLAYLGRLVVRRLDRAADVRPRHEVAASGSSEVRAIDGAQLRVTHVHKAFGGNTALKDVSLLAAPGRITALIGPNGSGKTTLLNMVCGFYRMDQGQIALDGEALPVRKPAMVAQAGVARTFQTPNIPAGITVLEAVAAGRFSGNRVSTLSTVLRLPKFRAERRLDLEEAWRVLALVGLSEHADTEAAALPLGMRRMLEVARALVAEPGVLMLDEVASGLDEEEIEVLATLVRRIRDAGGTIVLVEHNFRLVLELADEIYVLAHGEVIAVGTPDEIAVNPRVQSEYLGAENEVGDEAEALELAHHPIGGTEEQH